MIPQTMQHVLKIFHILNYTNGDSVCVCVCECGACIRLRIELYRIYYYVQFWLQISFIETGYQHFTFSNLEIGVGINFFVMPYFCWHEFR